MGFPLPTRRVTRGERFFGRLVYSLFVRILVGFLRRVGMLFPFDLLVLGSTRVVIHDSYRTRRGFR